MTLNKTASAIGKFYIQIQIKNPSQAQKPKS